MKTKLTMIGMVVFLLTVSILLTIYGAWLAYPLEIGILGLEKIVYMKADEIVYNMGILMNYLTNPWQQVLDMPSFSSSADGLKHFRDVKYLFHLVQLLFLISLPSVYSFVQTIFKKGYGKLVQPVFFGAGVLPIGVGLLGLVLGFDQFFVLFHQVLFPGDTTWLFHPNTDPVIYILPQEFFLHCFVAFFSVYQLLTWTSWYLCGRAVPEGK